MSGTPQYDNSNLDQNDIGEISKAIQTQLHMLEKFVARRFDEISMEINATSQQVDMAENGITSRFAEILDVIHAISYKGNGMTPANAGVELDAVVDMTEDAANRILDAANRITEMTGQPENWEDAPARERALQGINRHVDDIFMACSFQDLTSQRIKKTLENLKSIEDRLGGVLGRLGITLPSPEYHGDEAHHQKKNGSGNPLIDQNTAIATQDDIDSLFS